MAVNGLISWTGFISTFLSTGGVAGTAGPTGLGGGHTNFPFSKIILPRTTSSSKLIWK